VRLAGTEDALVVVVVDLEGSFAAAVEGRLAGTGADLAGRLDVVAVEAARVEALRKAISRHVANEGLLRHCQAVRGSGRAHAAKGEKEGRGFIVWVYGDWRVKREER
jgi:hypothetical protein